MSISIMVEGWNEQPSSQKKVYLKDEHPYLTDEDLDYYFKHEHGYSKDENGVYSIQRVYKNPFPELNYSNHNFSLLINAMGYQFDYSGSFPLEKLPELNQKIIKIINTGCIQNASDNSLIDGNFMHFGQSVIASRRKYNDILELIKFALENKKGIYWG